MEKHVFFAEITGRANVACFNDLAGYLVNKKWYTESKTNERPKKSSLVYGNRPGENFFMTHPSGVKCVSEYTFLISKNNKQRNKKQESKKAKETREEKISPKN